MMQLRLFKTLWGHSGPVEDAAKQAASSGLDGIEGSADRAGEQLAAFCVAINRTGN